MTELQNTQLYRYTGAVHMHTTESDGTKSLEDVAADANSAGLDFIMVTDHMTLSNKVMGKEGRHGKCIVIIGYEHNDQSDRHHYLIFDSPGVYDKQLLPAEYVQKAAADGALGIIAHPDEIRSRMKKYPPYPWLDWAVEGFNGIELWNQMSEWMERLTPTNQLWMALSPRKSMIAPTERILAMWDKINLERKCAGVASVDAHAFPVKVGPFTLSIFPYKVHFNSIRTDVLLREPMSADFEIAKLQILTAFRECRLICSNVRWGSIDGFRFEISNNKTSVCAGESVKLQAGLRLSAFLPHKARLRVVQDGALIRTTNAKELAIPIEHPGMYRLEAWRGRRAWILTNHIRVIT